MSSFERLGPLGPVGAAAAWAPPSLHGRRYGEDRLHLLVRDPRRVLAIWEISQATASSAVARASAASAPLRYQLRVERERDGGLAPETVAGADLPDALGGEGWYLAIPPRAGRCRALLGLDLGGRFESLLVSRWVATPPEGPCDAVAPWPLEPGGEAWVEREWREEAAADRSTTAPSSSARYLPPPVTGAGRAGAPREGER
ncbi:MAG TPA: DUF4912 domain-containing protein [Candidatus Eisenbacteria bacterium]|nr:DUF4912 domain-containing protein [Candidatus Eisenbacteria bacterium]